LQILTKLLISSVIEQYIVREIQNPNHSLYSLNWDSVTFEIHELSHVLAKIQEERGMGGLVNSHLVTRVFGFKKQGLVERPF
jgi:hypothetical protein